MRFQSLTAFIASALLLGGGSCLSDDQQRALDAHNQARAEHGLDGLSWDDGLAGAAQDWANQLPNVGFQHSGVGGENLYWSSASSGDVFNNAAGSWINEEPNYHGEAIPDGDFENYGHYSKRLQTLLYAIYMLHLSPLRTGPKSAGPSPRGPRAEGDLGTCSR